MDFTKKTAFIFLICIYLTSIALPIRAAEEYIIGPEDVLVITVYGEPELKRTVRVASNGDISFPLLGQVKVSGLTVSKIENKLTRLLGKDYLVNPQVTVFIQKYSTISILGAVKKPGSYPLRGKLTVLEAISLAGGFTKIAKPNGTKILRVEKGKQKTIKVKITDITKKGDKSKDIPLKPGDIVVVPESFF